MIDFTLTEEQEMLRDLVREFATREIAPVAPELDEEQRHSPEIVEKYFEIGFLHYAAPEEYGGAGADFDFLDLMIVIEEMGRKLLSGPFFSTMALCSLPLVRYGSPEQKKESLPGIARGEQIWTLAYLEPSATHDLSGVEMRAQLQDQEYHLSGTKTFVPFA